MTQKRNKRKPIRLARKARLVFYKTVHAILPREIRQPLRNAIKGPPQSPEEVAAEQQAQAAEREAERAEAASLRAQAEAARQAQRAEREAKKEAAQRERQSQVEDKAKNGVEVGGGGAVSRLPLSAGFAISAQRRLSRALVASGIRVRAWSRRGAEAGDVRTLAATGRFLIASGTMLGERSRAYAKEAKRRADDARAVAEALDPEVAGLPRVRDLRPLVAEQHARETELVRAELADLAAGDDPVVVGPFLGEVGFELLYWVPFVRWALAEFPRLRGRLIVVSRGGTRSWYGDGLSDYVDALDVFAAEEFVERRQDLKQRERTSLDLELVSAVGARFGLHRYKHLHPAVMWHGYYDAIKADERSYARAVHGPADGVVQPLLGLRSRYAPIAPPPPGELEPALPPEFVAARFYFRPSFPDTAANRAFAAALLAAISEHIPVVLLNNGLKLDEHADLDLSSPRIVTIGDHMTPANNLMVQTCVVSRARMFVGTYGGLAYLAPHLGVPSLAFLEDGLSPWPWHLELAQQIFRGPPWGSLAVLTTRDLDVLELFAGSLAQRQPARRLTLTAP